MMFSLEKALKSKEDQTVQKRHRRDGEIYEDGV